MKPTESIAELVMKYGACDVGTLIEKLGATCDDETLLFFEGIIRVVERSSPLDANAIRHCLARHGYPVNFIEQNTDWHDSNEDNYVKNCKDVPSNLLNSIKGAIMPFVASDEQKLFYNKLSSDRPHDISFSVISKGVIVLHVKCQIAGMEINNYGRPVTFIPGARNQLIAKSALRTAIRHLMLLRRVYCATTIRMLLDEITTEVCAGMHIVFDSIGIFLQTYIDLTMSERDIYSPIRKSYRPLINKYKHRLPVMVDDIHDIMPFLDGRHTALFSLEMQQHMNLLGLGRVLSYYNEGDRLIGVVGVTRIGCPQNRLSYYNFGAFEQDQQSHYAIYNAIMHMKQQSYNRWYFNICALERPQSTKFGSIQFFYAGFSPTIVKLRVGLTSMKRL